jgi:hypothetical protein
LVGVQLALAGAARADAPSSIASAPDNSSGGPISVTYSATVGTTSVELWVKGPADSGYARSETDTTPDSPSFMYLPTEGNGTYAFYTVAVGAGGTREQPPPSPDATTLVQAASVPVVAAITMPGGQKLGTVLEKGLLIRLYAYRPVSLQLTLLLQPRTAKALRVRNAKAGTRQQTVSKPGVYDLRVRLKKSLAQQLWLMRSAGFELRTALSTGNAVSKASSRFTIPRL